MLTIEDGELSDRGPAWGGDDVSPALVPQLAGDSGPHATDEALLRAIARGDRHALGLLYTWHSKQVYRYILRMTRHEILAEDIVGDVFLQVWRQAGGVTASAQVSTWLLTIARDKALSALGHRCHERPDGPESGTIEPPQDDPDITAHDRNRGARIRTRLSQLSMAHREVVDLTYYHAKSIDEVAGIVGASASTVKTRMVHARRRMREFLETSGHDGG